jgi:D-apionolactonase
VSDIEVPGPVERRWGGPRTPLRHGRWTLEVRGDEVADVRFDGILLLRAIRPVVRDRDWNTVPVQVLESRSTGDPAGLVAELAFRAEGISYRGTLRLQLGEDELVVDFRGEAQSDFERNRIGLVVLHPAGDAGREVEVRHSDGGASAGRWPGAISPHQPFRDVAGFGWTTRGVTAELALDGDVFETEDQRNWTDASFKTYSTPLDRPFPVQVRTGDICRQQARLRATGRATPGPRRTEEVVTVGSAVVGHLPALGLGACLYPPPPVPPTAPATYETLLVELADVEERWPALLATAVDQARVLGAGLDVRVVTAEPAAVRRCLALLRNLPVRRLAAFDPDNHLTTAPVWTALRDEAARTAFPVALVGGTRAHFTELNRGQLQLPPDLPALTFSLTPQMHACEVPHLVDSLSTQRTVVDNAVRIAAGRPLHVGPVTLARRFNAVATTARPGPDAEAAAAVDSLQDTAFAAAWTLASVAALSAPGVTSLCFFETVGPRGVLHPDGRPTPAGGVLQDLALCQGRRLLAVEVPDGVAALAVVEDDGVDTRLANLGPEPRTVEVRLSAGPARTVRLAPWAVSTVRLG